MRRTTIFADEELLHSLRHIARQEGLSIAELVRRALTKYIADRREPSKRLSFLGAGRSGRRDIAERNEDLLRKRPAVRKSHN